MTLTDTHAHLYWDSFKKDLDQVIKRAQQTGVSCIINIGVDVESSKKALALSQKYPNFYSSIGIHPHEASKYTPDEEIQNDIEKLEKIFLLDTNHMVAIGECGLDYMGVDEQIKDLQRKLFQAQIDLAKKLNLPLIVHCRDDRSKNPNNTECWDEVIEMTKEHFGIYHCYSGLPPTTNSILQTTRFLFSFAGNFTYPKNEYLREAAKLIPMDRIVLETDCPFLPPQSKRGIRNEPANVKEIAQLLAELKGISLEQVANDTTDNVKKLLRLA